MFKFSVRQSLAEEKYSTILQLACNNQGTQESNMRRMHQYSYPKSTMFTFSLGQSLAEEKYSIILQTSQRIRIVLKLLSS